jgi:cytochrome c oxidase subunit 3
VAAGAVRAPRLPRPPEHDHPRDVELHEFTRLGFAPSDLAFGSTFYGLTGLHGAHVFVGLNLLAYALVRALRGHYGPAPHDHLGVELPGIYWHFVDVMWIVVYTTVYVL